MIYVEKAWLSPDSYPTAESFVVKDFGALVLYDEQDDEVAAYPPGGWLRVYREVSR